MMEVYPTLPKFMVQECQDEDDLTDIDDEVFIRDGKNGVLKFEDDGGVKRPLMAPRQKPKKFYKIGVHRFPYKALFIPICYGLIALAILLGLIALCIYTANILPMSLTILKKWIFQDLKTTMNNAHIIPCTSLSSKIIWTKTIPKFTSEAPLRSLNAENTPTCYDYSDIQVPCLGGILALDGKTGNISWTHWTSHPIFSVDCGLDITDDNINDCIALGEDEILYAINGQDGSSIWEIPNQELLSEDLKLFEIYDAKFTIDTDGDNIGDIIAIGTSQSDLSHSSKMLIISAKKGNILNTINFPSIELLSAPRTIVHPDGENILVLTANNQMQFGALFIAPSTNFIHGDIKLKELHHSSGKAALLPPVLVDVTLDGVVDIIASMFDSTIIVYDGLTFDPIWNYTVPDSEILSIPVPGYYNDDNIPDFMVKHQVKSGFPKYYYTISMVIDGKTGQPLLKKPIEDSLNKQMSGLSITIDGYGNDWFLHWSGNCLNTEDFKKMSQAPSNKKVIWKKHVDLCKVKFNSTLTTKLIALSQHVGPPGIILYSSEEYKMLELNNSVDIEKEIDKYLESYRNIDSINIDNLKLYKDYEKGIEYTANRNEDMLRESNNYHQKLHEMTYENPELFEEDKFNTNFQLNDIENVDVETSLRSKDKWITNNNIAKEYDSLFDNDNSNNVGDNQVMDNSKQHLSGILLPSFVDAEGGNSVDFIFSTSESLLSESFVTLAQEDLDCIYRKKASYKNNMHNKKNTDIITECLNERDNNLYEKVTKRNNINIALGQMTIYRMKLECVCPEDILPNQICKTIALKQSWPEYLGLYGSGYFRPLNTNI